MNRITTPFIIMISTLFLSSLGFSEVLHWPQDCECGTLNIQNTTNTEMSVWLQKRDPTVYEQEELPLNPKETISKTYCHASDSEKFSLFFFEKEASIQTTWNCKESKNKAIAYSGGEQTYSRSFLGKTTIWIKNLNTSTNTLKATFLDQNKNILGSEILTLKPSGEMDWSPTFNKTWKQVRLTAEHKFTSLNRSTNTLARLSAEPAILESTATYFVIGPREGLGDQFVVRITNKEMIEKARLQIQDPTLEKIIFGRIERGHQKFNRNLSRPEQPYWSWSVTEVTNISDFGSTSCNGFPQLVEDNLDMWLQDPRICFWNYRIKKELKP